MTGAAGFVGYAVAALLVEQGNEVTGLTRSDSSALPRGVRRIRGDLTKPETLPDVIGQVDGVCHLAGCTRVRESRSDPVGYWRTNVGGTLTLLDALSVASPTRLVLASTCGVYGEQATPPISETAALRPSNPYGTSKLAAEASAFVLALHSCEPGTWRAYNVGSGRASTVSDVISTVESVTKRPVRRRHAPAAPEPHTLLADSTLIRAELGWQPHRSSLDQIITDAWTALTCT